MEKFRFLQDVALADICFEAYGVNLNKLFENAALALEEVMVDTKSIRETENKKLEITGDSLEDLLFRFLEELVYLKDSKELLFNKFQIQVVNTIPVRLSARLVGGKIDPQNQKLRTDVKAVTYHMFEVKKEGEKWRARVVVDV